MVAVVVTPYLGYDGLYMGSVEPVVRATRNTQVNYRKKPGGI